MGNDDWRRRDGNRGKTEGPAVRPWLLVTLAVLIALAFVAFVVAPRVHFIRGLSLREANVVAREQRVHAAAHVALAPLPVADPIVQRPGTDAYGYPRSYVDQSALRSLLGRGKFAELSAYLEKFQAQAAADFHDEYFINDSSDAFDSAEREIEPSLDAWVKATPNSFAPYLARGAHRYASGFALRGFNDVRATPTDNITAMNAAFALSFSDLEHALQIEPKLMPALRGEMRIAFAGAEHKAEFAAFAARAFSTCPGCFQVRITEQVALEPRWGGSYAAMAAAAARADSALNPRFKLLPGYALDDQALAQRSAGDGKAGLASAKKADALGQNADFALELARALEDQDDDLGAMQAVNRALDLRPSRVELLLLRAHLFTREANKNWEAAYRDLMAGLRLAPSDRQARASLPYVAQALIALGWEAHQHGDENKAIRLLDQASEIAPSHELEQRREAVLISGFHGKPEEIVALSAAAEAAPHDFYAHERLDYALSQTREWDRIAAMWSAYIAQNPLDGKAYYERGGTYSNSGQAEAATADAARACELGVSAACAISR